jgi:hypothetical protein
VVHSPVALETREYVLFCFVMNEIERVLVPLVYPAKKMKDTSHVFAGRQCLLGVRTTGISREVKPTVCSLPQQMSAVFWTAEDTLHTCINVGSTVSLQNYTQC